MATARAVALQMAAPMAVVPGVGIAVMRAVIVSGIGKPQAVALAALSVALAVVEAQHAPILLAVLPASAALAAAVAGGRWSVAMNDEER